MIIRCVIAPKSNFERKQILISKAHIKMPSAFHLRPPSLVELQMTVATWSRARLRLSLSRPCSHSPSSTLSILKSSARNPSTDSLLNRRCTVFSCYWHLQDNNQLKPEFATSHMRQTLHLFYLLTLIKFTYLPTDL